MDAYKFN